MRWGRYVVRTLSPTDGYTVRYCVLYWQIFTFWPELICFQTNVLGFLSSLSVGVKTGTLSDSTKHLYISLLIFFLQRPVTPLNSFDDVASLSSNFGCIFWRKVRKKVLKNPRGFRITMLCFRTYTGRRQDCYKRNSIAYLTLGFRSVGEKVQERNKK